MSNVSHSIIFDETKQVQQMVKGMLGYTVVELDKILSHLTQDFGQLD